MRRRKRERYRGGGLGIDDQLELALSLLARADEVIERMACKFVDLRDTYLVVVKNGLEQIILRDLLQKRCCKSWR